MLKFGYVDIFRGKPEVARKHERAAAVNRDLQLGSGQCRRATDPVERVKQSIAVEGCSHRALMKTLPQARASSG
jgi:hypothetical protein